MTEHAEVICAERADQCVCKLPPDHGPVHECVCGGSWRGTSDTGDFEVVRWPSGLECIVRISDPDRRFNFPAFFEAFTRSLEEDGRWWADPERRTKCSSCDGRGYHLPIPDGSRIGCDDCGAIGYVQKEST